MRLASILPASLALCTACSTPSTITGLNDPTVEDHIVGGDAENVYVGSKDSPEAIPERASRLFVTPIVGTEKGQPSGAAVVGTF